MSRRDIVVNTLLGLLLVAVFLLPFLLALAVAGYALQVLYQGVQHFWPGVYNPKVMIIAVFSVLSLGSGMRKVWKRRWMGAFLSFAMLPVIASMALADAHSAFALNAPLWSFGLLPILVFPGDSGPTRSQFFLAGSTVCAVIAINTGLLGSGHPARIVTDCLLAAIFIWFVVEVRQGWSGPKSPDPTVPLSPTHS